MRLPPFLSAIVFTKQGVHNEILNVSNIITTYTYVYSITGKQFSNIYHFFKTGWSLLKRIHYKKFIIMPAYSQLPKSIPIETWFSTLTSQSKHKILQAIIIIFLDVANAIYMYNLTIFGLFPHCPNFLKTANFSHFIPTIHMFLFFDWTGKNQK